jgi:hypothetical protein
MEELAFADVASQFKNTGEYNKFIAACQYKYDIRIYRYTSLTITAAKKIYH